MKYSLIVAFFAIFPCAQGIVVSDYTIAEQAPSNLDWSSVYNYKESSAVAVNAYWILTAAHVADDSGDGALSINNQTYNQQQIVFHPTSDLALVRYDKAFPAFYDLYTGTFSSSDELILVGYGTTGNVVNTIGNNDYWTDSGTGRGTQRWGTQRYSSNEVLDYEIDLVSTTNDGFWMDFTVGQTTYEAGVGIGDSGGGSFINDDGTWKLAGINTSRSGRSGEYDATFSIKTQAYSDWISETIPEPAAATLVVISGMAIFFIKRLFT